MRFKIVVLYAYSKVFLVVKCHELYMEFGLDSEHHKLSAKFIVITTS